MANYTDYNSIWEGKQIDDAIGRIVNGDLDQLASQAANSATNAGISATNANNSAQAAQQSATNAATSATAASGSASTAQTHANTAKGHADNAKKSADDAKAAQTAAETAKTAAESAKNSANTAQTAAEAAQTGAETAQAAAEKARDDAKASATAAAASATNSEKSADDSAQSAADAEKSADTAKQYSGKPPKPLNGTWWIWNADDQEYKDTGIKSVLAIVKSYPSIADMEADLSNMAEGDLVIIASNVNDEDNSKLFVHSGTAWVFLSDLSGIQGVGIANITLTSGQHLPGTTDTYTITLTDGTDYTFSVYNGRNGEGAGDVNGIAFQIVVPASGWVDGTLSVQDARFLSAGRYNYIVGTASENRDEYVECGLWAEDILTDGTITFHSEVDPEKDMKVNILRLEVNSDGTGV